MKERKSDLSNEQGRGWKVFIALAVLTAIEFGISIGLTNPLPALTAIALIKAWLIITYFMHIPQLWRKEAHG